jgi:hypothetical protein
VQLGLKFESDAEIGKSGRFGLADGVIHENFAGGRNLQDFSVFGVSNPSGEK